MMDIEEIDANGRSSKDLFDRFLPFDNESGSTLVTVV